MAALFFIWGGLGFLFIGLTVINPASNSSVSLISSVALIWIGGMVFFGLGSILWRTNEANGGLISQFRRWRND